MLYNPPTGSTDPNASYVGANTAAGTQGSRVPKAAVEAPQREIVATISGAGIQPSADDNTQLLQAIKALIGKAAPESGTWHYGAASGTASAILVPVVVPAITAYKPGLTCLVAMPSNFATATSATLSLAGLPAGNLMRNDGSAIQQGDGPAGAPMLVMCDGLGGFRLVGFGRAEVPRNVPSPILYVRPDGSDVNDGSANDSAHAYATVSAAVLAGSSRFSLVGGALTIQLGVAGTYDAPQFIPQTLGTLNIVGDPANQGSYFLAGAGPAGNSGVITASGGTVNLRGVTLRNTGTTNNTLSCGGPVTVTCTNVTFTSNAPSTGAHMQAGAGAQIIIGAGCVFASSMRYLASVLTATIQVAANITLANTPNFSGATILAQTCGVMSFAPGVAFIGTPATGQRYIANSNAIIQTYGAGATFVPGDSSGTTNTGGVYA